MLASRVLLICTVSSCRAGSWASLPDVGSRAALILHIAGRIGIMSKGLINDLRSILPVMYGYEEDGLACCWHLEKQTR